MVQDILQEKDFINFNDKLMKQIYKFDIQNHFSEIVFLCVGSNKIVGDMIGPIVGEMLSKELLESNGILTDLKDKIIIYGNMEKNLNLKNASKVIRMIEYKYKKPFIITIDTALGSKEMINKICISNGTIEIGKALKNEIKYESHINIKGVVGLYSNNIQENIQTLKTVAPNKIIYLSDIISCGIKEMIKQVLI